MTKFGKLVLEKNLRYAIHRSYGAILIIREQNSEKPRFQGNVKKIFINFMLYYCNITTIFYTTEKMSVYTTGISTTCLISSKVSFCFSTLAIATQNSCPTK